MPPLLAFALAFAACSAPDDTGPRSGRPDARDSGADSTGGDTGDTGDTGPFDTAGSDGPCPSAMVPVTPSGSAAFCIDVVEAALQEWDGGAWVDASPYDTVDDRQVRAVSQPGQVPQGYISGDEADAACAAAGKRLCTSAEWLTACQGPQGHTWPYGDTHVSGACNDSYGGSHPVIDYFGTSDGIWDTTSMNDPGINQQDGTVAPGGDHADCVSDDGAYDMHGNLHEWVSDADGTFRGGFYADGSINGSGCLYATTAHSRGYHDYSTGFRCCAEPVGG